MSSITGFATTTDTGDPIAVPFTCWYTFPLNDKKVASKHMDSRLMMSSTVRLVHSGRDESLSSLRRATWMAKPVGIQVNNDITSKDTRVLSFDNVCDLMNLTNAWSS